MGMTRFEQRISEDEVTAARKKIAAGASLRSAAAEIPCAASTLSLRIKKAEKAEADARDPARIGDNEHRAAGAPEDPGLHAIASREGAIPGEVGPVEILRGALHATKVSGQPDWPTRVSAARALAALRPEEVEPEQEQQPAPSIVVYDLPPGTDPVLHRAPNGGADAVSEAEAPSEQPPQIPNYVLFAYEPPDGEIVQIGSWFSASRDRSPGRAIVNVSSQTTDDRETAELWRAELAAGKLPQNTEDEP
jgi:hypothetical protein